MKNINALRDLYRSIFSLAYKQESIGLKKENTSAEIWVAGISAPNREHLTARVPAYIGVA
jgi:hypothetical protein